MFKIIFVCLVILPLSSFAADSNNFNLLCFDEMVSYGSELFTELESSTNVEIKLENPQFEGFSMVWKAPKDKYNGSELIMTMIATSNSCIIK